MEVPEVSDLVSTYDYCLKYHYFPTQSVTNAVLTVVGDGIAQSVEAGSDEGDGINMDMDMDIDIDIDNHTNASGSDYSYDPKRGIVYFFKGLGSGIFWAWWFGFAEVWSVELTQSLLSHATSTAAAAANNFQQSTTDILEFAATDMSTSTSTTTSTMTMLSFKAQSVRTAINVLLEQFLVCPLVFSAWDIPVTAVMRGSSVRQIPEQIKEKLPPLFVANAKVWTGVNIVTYNIPLEYRLLFTSAASIVSESINAGITSKRIGSTEEPTPAVRTPGIAAVTRESVAVVVTQPRMAAAATMVNATAAAAAI